MGFSFLPLYLLNPCVAGDLGTLWERGKQSSLRPFPRAFQLISIHVSVLSQWPAMPLNPRSVCSDRSSPGPEFSIMSSTKDVFGSCILSLFRYLLFFCVLITGLYKIIGKYQASLCVLYCVDICLFWCWGALGLMHQTLAIISLAILSGPHCLQSSS